MWAKRCYSRKKGVSHCRSLCLGVLKDELWQISSLLLQMSVSPALRPCSLSLPPSRGTESIMCQCPLLSISLCFPGGQGWMCTIAPAPRGATEAWTGVCLTTSAPARGDFLQRRGASNQRKCCYPLSNCSSCCYAWEWAPTVPSPGCLPH